MPNQYWVFEGAAECERCRELRGMHYIKPPTPPIHPNCNCVLVGKCEAAVHGEYGGFDFDAISVGILVNIFIVCCDGSQYYVGTDRISASHDNYWNNPEALQELAIHTAVEFADTRHDLQCPELVA